MKAVIPSRKINVVWKELPRKGKRNVILGSLMLLVGTIGPFWEARAGLLYGVLFVVGAVMFSEGLLRVSKRIRDVDDTDQARELMVEMIRSAKEHILLTSGSLHPAAYLEWKNEQIRRALEQKLLEKVRLEIICGEPIHEASKKMLKPWLQKYPHFRFYSFPGDPVPHGMLVDDIALRLERPHALDARDRRNLHISNPTTAAALFLATFDRYRYQANAVQSETILAGIRTVEDMQITNEREEP